MWPWGRRKREREAALARAEAALREATAGFYEVELCSRRVEFVASEVRRIADEGIGLAAGPFTGLLEACAVVVANLDSTFGAYFEDLDALTPLGRHGTAEELDRAALGLAGWAEQFDEYLVAQAETKESIDNLFEKLAGFRPVCAPLMRTAVDALEAAREELAALAAEGITSRPLKRALRETGAALSRLRKGQTGTEGREQVASSFRRLHAEAEDIRRRIRLARPLTAAFGEEPVEVPV